MKCQGGALIITLLIVMMLSVFAITQTQNSKNGLDNSVANADQILSRWHNVNDMKLLIYSLSSLNASVFDLPFGETEINRTFNQPLTFGDTSTVIVRDISSRLNLVPFRPEEWLGVLKFYGVAEPQSRQLVDSILDWMDSDNLVRLNGREAIHYNREQLSIVPRNALMQSLDELLFIPNMDHDLLSTLEPEISYWGTSNRTPHLGSNAMRSSYGYVPSSPDAMQSFEAREEMQAFYRNINNPDVENINRVGSMMLAFEITSKVGGASSKMVVDLDFSGTTFTPFSVLDVK